ncbi:hypothetical protein ASZ78_006988 [Callipepla squamata]|uniref:1-acylglycerol-3-phosphate O-acyltransferase n=1 Tax=Callipepla squamata TaxID=9009 RepID=A0A226M9I1_CALSU|nr:hypothetical protein ASZ78_006988 [Callipepla squamata]
MMEVLPDRCVPIAKRELLYMGAVGAACWLGGIIFIDRKRTRDAINVMAEAAHTMLSQDVGLCPTLGGLESRVGLGGGRS